jgi:hypothetical protein
MSLVKRLHRRPGLTHRIKIGDGVVVLISDPGARFAPGEEVKITLKDLDQSQIKLVIDAPKEATPVYLDIENR